MLLKNDRTTSMLQNRRVWEGKEEEEENVSFWSPRFIKKNFSHKKK